MAPGAWSPFATHHRMGARSERRVNEKRTRTPGRTEGSKEEDPGTGTGTCEERQGPGRGGNHYHGSKKNFCDVAGPQGRLIPPARRLSLCESIDEAKTKGVRMAPVCEALGIHPRTYSRWKDHALDRRKGSPKKTKRSLTEEERRKIIEVCTSDRFKDSTPGEIVAILAEEGIYIASERSFYRVLKNAGLLHHRRNSRPARKVQQPPELKATGPDQVYSWDITWLPSKVNGLFWYCYAVIDVWSREIVGWSIHERESEQHGRELFESIKQRRNLNGVWVHSDNGNPMRGATFSVWLASLGMFLSHSRPLVKNDNPYIESFFRTLKYHAAYPGRFATIEQARSWMGDFIDWYNRTHRHSGLGYITPEQRRCGDDIRLFALRNKTLQKAFELHPERFPKRGPKMWKSKRVVYLNPSHETKRVIHQRIA